DDLDTADLDHAIPVGKIQPRGLGIDDDFPQHPAASLSAPRSRLCPLRPLGLSRGSGGAGWTTLQTKLTDKAYRQRLQAKPYPIAQGFRPTSARRRSRGDL